MTHPLDRPAWSALTSRHARLAEGGDLARRYAPGIHSFISARDDSPEALTEMGALVRQGESLYVAQASEPVLPAGIVSTMTAAAVQMIAERRFEPIEDRRILALGIADAQEMLDLATLTRPGPFSLRSLELGRFWGIRIDGRLAAMAGERMQQDGFVELSGVCAHPDFRGRGLARQLSLFVAGRICEQGDVPYLHAFATNAAAIALYESIGFGLRCQMHVAVIQRG